MNIMKMKLAVPAAGVVAGFLVILGLLSFGSGGTQLIPADIETATLYKKNATILGTNWEIAMIIDVYEMNIDPKMSLSTKNTLLTQLNQCQIKEDVYVEDEWEDEDGNTHSRWEFSHSNYYNGALEITHYLELPDTEKSAEAVIQKVREKNGTDGDEKYEVTILVNFTELEGIIDTYYPDLSDKLQEMLELYNSHYFYNLYMDILQEDGNAGFDTGTENGYTGNIKFDATVAGKAAEWACSKVGCAYDKNHRFDENIFDCSSLVYRAYKTVGVDISWHGATTAAEEARGLEARGCQIGYSELKTGDLVFFSSEVNNRYKNITHVAMYIGNGQIVHARNKKMGVRTDSLDIYSQNSIRSIARPSGLLGQ